MNGLIKKLFGIKDESKPEVVASHYFMCKGIDKGDSYAWDQTLEYPVIAQIFNNGSANIICPNHPKGIKDYCTAYYSPVSAPACPYCIRK